VKRDLTSLHNRVLRRRVIASDQERKPTQHISLILETGNDFCWRRMIAGIDWSYA